MSYYFKNKGFSLIELLVSISIVTIILTVVSLNQSTYTDTIALTQLADEISLTLSEAQAYGSGVRELTPGSANFTGTYGVAFSILDDDSNTSYISFADKNDNQAYDDDWSCPVGDTSECLSSTPISRGNIISGLCVIRPGPDQCNVISRVDISFARPNTEAQLTFYDNSGNVYVPPNALGVRIVLESSKETTREVLVYPTGQISALLAYEDLDEDDDPPPPPPPTVTTSVASSITTTTATLNGIGNPNGDLATGWFRYNTSNPGSCNDSFGTRVPVTGGSSLGSSSNPKSYLENLSGLSQDTAYYYCAIASNSGGNGYGSIVSFTTNEATLQTQNFTSNGIWIRPKGVDTVSITMVGGGGGGGSNNGHPEGNGAGGGGAQAWTNVAVAVSGNVSVIVGQGGAGHGLAYVGSGAAGGNSVFSTLTASGGQGGQSGEGSGGNCVAVGGAAGGPGGNPGQGTISEGGNNQCSGGAGGDTIYGSGGATGAYTSGCAIGGNGTNGGGGGGGGLPTESCGSSSGGNGGNGFVTVTWWE